jgi:hypothetical protein
MANLVTLDEKIKDECGIGEFRVRYICGAGATARIGSIRFSHVWFKATVPRTIGGTELPIFPHISGRRVRKITIQKTDRAMHGVVDGQARRCSGKEDEGFLELKRGKIRIESIIRRAKKANRKLSVVKTGG